MDVKRALSVGEVAKRSGVAVSTIHFYEAKGMITASRSAGNQRRYPRAVLRRVAIIKVAQRAGIPLAVIQKFLGQLPVDQPVTAKEWRDLTGTWQSLIDERIVSLTQLRDQLDSCIGCGCLSLVDCPLRNYADKLSVEGSGPRILIGENTALPQP